MKTENKPADVQGTEAETTVEKLVEQKEELKTIIEEKKEEAKTAETPEEKQEVKIEIQETKQELEKVNEEISIQRQAVTEENLKELQELAKKQAVKPDKKSSDINTLLYIIAGLVLVVAIYYVFKYLQNERNSKIEENGNGYEPTEYNAE